MGRLRSLFLRTIGSVVCAGALASGCSSAAPTPTPPPTPVPDPPQISCPAPAAQVSPNGQALAVTYPAPSVVLGATPVTTACTPASGTPFNIGTTPVTCTATDARQRSASCSFNVVVQAPARINLTRFVAFGDSLTAGEDGNSTLTAALNRSLGFEYPTVILRGREYPTVLAQLLAARYSTQQLLIVNAGSPGESVGGNTTCSANCVLSRFTAISSSRAYDVILLMEGTNDIFGGTGGNPLGIPPAIANLRRMIADARSRGLRLFLATVPPANPAGPRGLERYQAIPPLNAQIRQLAVSEGVPLVDVFNAFNNNFLLLSADGTHPNADGYALIASTFYDAIRRELEAPAAPVAPMAPVVLTR